MFSRQKEEIIAKKNPALKLENTLSQVQGFPSELILMTKGYFWAPDEDEDFWKPFLIPKFSSDRYSFFKQQFYHNEEVGTTAIACVVGVCALVLVAFCLFSSTPCDIIFTLILLGYAAFSYALSLFSRDLAHKLDLFMLCTLLGLLPSLCGLIISFVPALLYTVYKTRNCPSGEEIYDRLKSLEGIAKNNEPEANLIINEIREKYKNSISTDQNSNALYETLSSNTNSLEIKTAAIANYMETRNKNAGKNLFHIILDSLEPKLLAPIQDRMRALPPPEQPALGLA